jgi:hypothetical protein
LAGAEVMLDTDVFEAERLLAESPSVALVRD